MIGMTKLYYYKKAKRLIKEELAKEPDNVESFSLGMVNDWFWTAETIWKDGKYTRNLFSGDVKKEYKRYVEYRDAGNSSMSAFEEFGNFLFGGIAGSYRDTPVLKVEYKDGKEKTIPCYIEYKDNPR